MRSGWSSSVQPLLNTAFKHRQQEAARGLGLELGTLVKGSVNAASSSEGLDSGIDAHVISPTAWFLELYVQVSRVLTHGFCFIDADGQKQLQPSKPSLLLRLISKRKKEGF